MREVASFPVICYAVRACLVGTMSVKRIVTRVLAVNVTCCLQRLKRVIVER